MNQILIVQLSRLGDAVQTLPLTARLRQEHPDARISLACLEPIAPIIRASGLVDNTICINTEDMTDLTRPDAQADRIRIEQIAKSTPGFAQEYDLIINVTHTLACALLCESIPAKTRVGRMSAFAGETRVLGTWGKYFFAATKDRQLNTYNLVDIYTGMGEIPQRPIQDYIKVSPEARENALRLLREHGYKESKPLVALQMGANKMHRAWPVENFAAVAEKLTGEYNAQIVLLGAAGEQQLCERFGSLYTGEHIPLTGKTDLITLAAVLKQCGLLISNDTGTVHIAAAVGTRVLGLYFSTAYYAETGPYGAGNVILQAARPCAPCFEQNMCPQIACREDIDVSTVANTATAMLDNTPIPAGAGNVRTYQSRFLNNGALMYLPIDVDNLTSVEHNAFTFRIMWEAAMGLEHDQKVLTGITHVMASEGLPQWPSWLRGCYSQAVATAENILQEFRKRPIKQERIMNLTDKLKAIESQIIAREDLPPLIRHFLNMVMTDLPYAKYPDMAKYLAYGYRQLEKKCAGFERGLKAIKEYHKLSAKA